mmetsp:Transcript_89882/g.110052  ORF Transcript_89882/g.110052 Transcript_89882/m.110052 type:complete len:101 (+) Transcript_89882:109-411(+)
MQKPKDLTIDEIKKVHEAFQPLLLSELLRKKLDEVTANKKSKDDAQKERLNLCISILNCGISLPAYPDKTKVALLDQMNKQLKKISKKKKKKVDATEAKE